MAEIPATLKVTFTPGKNEKIDNTIYLEKILDKLHKSVSEVSGPAPPEHKESMLKVQQLAGDLLRELRTLRGIAP